MEPDLKEALARQSLLLQFVSDCNGLSSVEALFEATSSQLHWIADYQTCSVLLKRQGQDEYWTAFRGEHLQKGKSASLTPGQHAALDAVMLSGAPMFTERQEAGAFSMALPLTGASHPLGAIFLSRTRPAFSQGDVRSLHHASKAIGAALGRMLAVETGRQAVQDAELAEAELRSNVVDRALLAEQMIGIVSHDLCNPLATVMMGVAALARSEQLQPRSLRLIESVQKASKRARRMVDDLLDFTMSRVGHGMTIVQKRVDLHELVAEGLNELSLAFPGRNFLQERAGAGDAFVDPDRIEQLLGNLAANAVAYGAPDQPIVLRSSIRSGTAELAVHNQGPPIPPDLANAIFEPLVRGEATTSHTRSVGLGLFIVRAIAEAHGGQVQVQSNSVDGTTFTVRFPADPT